MIFTLTDRQYTPLGSAYETDDYLIEVRVGNIIKALDLNVLTTSDNAEHWIEGNYVMCEDASGYQYWFTIRDVEDGAMKDEKQITCYSGTLDIVNEDANPIEKPSTPQPFEYYFNRILNDTGITIGINEISDLTRSLEFTSTDVSNVEMLQYVLNGFDGAEADLAVDFNGCVPTSIVLNVYKRIGYDEPQTILSDEDDSLTELDRTGSIADLATALNLFGKEDENEQPITLAGKYYEEKDEAGNILYYSPLNHTRIYSVIGRENYYVELPNKENGEFDGYINRRYESQAASQDALWSAGLEQLKKIDHAIVSYEAKGSIDCKAGDDIQIISHQMKPPVMISARVLEYKFNDDDPSRNEYVFGNYEVLESNIDALSALLEEVKKSVIYINSQIVEYTLDSQGNEPPTTGWISEQPSLSPGRWLWTRTTTNLSNGDKTYAYSVSRAGADGLEGRSIANLTEEYYLSTSKTSTTGGSWSATRPDWTSGKYVWTRIKTDYTNPEGTTYTDPIIDSSWEAIDGIEIGGRNLLIGSSEEEKEYTTLTDSVLSISELNSDRMWFEKNKEYTFSFEMKAEEGVTRANYNYLWASSPDTGSNTSIGPINDIIDDGEWHRYSLTFSFTSDRYGFVAIRFDSRVSGVGSNIPFSIRRAQLERGNKATDRTPAPEDVEQAYTAVAEAKATLAETQAKAHADGIVSAEEQSRINDAQAKLTEAKTYADGLVENIELMPGPAGENAITGYLTNEAITVPANNAGTVTSFTGADGYFRVMDGNNQALSGISFSKVSQSGMNVNFNSSGFYDVTSVTSDVGSAILQAVYKGTTIQKILMVVKNKQGPTGPQGSTGSQGPKGKTGAIGPKGDSTGVYESSTAPISSVRYVGMLWKNTSNGITYRWTGSSWGVWLISTANLSVENLSAISANIGTVTAGIIKGKLSELNLNTGRFRSYQITETTDRGNYVEIGNGTLDSKNNEEKSYMSVRAGIINAWKGPFSDISRAYDELIQISGESISKYYYNSMVGGLPQSMTLGFTKQGIKVQAGSNNTGDNANSGIEIMGNASYIDFHSSNRSTEDYGARILYGLRYGDLGPKLEILNNIDDVQIQTRGNLHVLSETRGTYKSVRAKSFDPQSAYSSKTDFGLVNKSQLLEEVIQTDIVKYRYMTEQENDETDEYVGFIVNDNGKSPFNISSRLVNIDGESYNLTSAVGMSFAAIQALYERIRKLESEVLVS